MIGINNKVTHYAKSNESRLPIILINVKGINKTIKNCGKL